MPKPLTRKSIVAATSGNVLEWYDFTVYGFLAPVIGKVFFPEGDHLASILSAFAVLAVGYAVRPLGSVIFGHIGDRIGRKPALMISVILMGAGSLGIACLPTYDQVGILAAILLVAIRVIQGISVAGEYTASGVLIVEQSPPDRRALNGAYVACAMMTGCVLGSAVPALLATVFTEDQIAAWAWRLPFLFGAVVAVFSAVLRRHLQESLEVSEAGKTGASPVLTTLVDHWHVLVRMMVLLIPTAVIYFMIFVYAASYLTDEVHLSPSRALDITTANLLIMAAIAPVLGILADRFGLRPIFMVGAVGTVFLTWPLWGLMHQSDWKLIFLGQMGLALLNGIGWALSVTALNVMAPKGLTCSAVALGYNICMAVFGGTTPIIATWLVSRTSDDFAPVYYLVATAVLSMWAIWHLPGKAKQAPGGR